MAEQQDIRLARDVLEKICEGFPEFTPGAAVKLCEALVRFVDHAVGAGEQGPPVGHAEVARMISRMGQRDAEVLESEPDVFMFSDSLASPGTTSKCAFGLNFIPIPETVRGWVYDGEERVTHLFRADAAGNLGITNSRESSAPLTGYLSRELQRIHLAWHKPPGRFSVKVIYAYRV